jgi:hypothetical protein
MWTITGLTHPPAGFDGKVYRWNLTRGGEQCFTDVEITGGALVRGEEMTPRSIEAVETQGRSEVERYLADEVPPRAIRVGTQLNPKVTRQRDT